MEVFARRYKRMTCAALLIVAPFTVFSQSNRAAAARVPAPSIAPSVAPANPSARHVDLDDHHRIRPGDKLSFRIAEDGEEAKNLPVTDSGEIELPYSFGRFSAANKTCKQLAQEIKAALEKEYYHRATIYLALDTINNVRGKAYVAGQVAKPGPVNIPVDSPLKLSQAILLVGPPTQWAKLSEVKVFRKKGNETESIIVDVGAILNKGRLDKDVVLEPDDVVIVPERGVLIGG